MRKANLALVLGLAGALALVACEGHRGGGSGSSTTVVTAGEGEGLPRVMIKTFDAKGVPPASVGALESKFCIEVARNKKVDLLCAEDLPKLFEHQQDLLLMGQCQEDDCLARIAKAANADQIISVSIALLGETYVLQATLADGPSGKVKTRIQQEVKGDEESLLGAMAGLADKVNEAL